MNRNSRQRVTTSANNNLAFSNLPLISNSGSILRVSCRDSGSELEVVAIPKLLSGEAGTRHLYKCRYEKPGLKERAVDMIISRIIEDL